MVSSKDGGTAFSIHTGGEERNRAPVRVRRGPGAEPGGRDAHPSPGMGEKPIIEVRYPLERGRLTLRTDADWDRDIEPVRADRAGGRFEFRPPAGTSFFYFKPVVHDDAGLHWALGENS